MTQPPHRGGPQQPAHQPYQQPGYPPPQPGYPPQQGYPPPQQGYQAPPPQGYPQQAPPMYQQPGHHGYPPQGPPPGFLPPRPSQLGVLATLNWIIAAGMIGFSAFIVFSFITTDSTLVVGILLAAIVGGFGGLNVLAAMSINHPHFPNTAASQMACGFAVALLGIAFVRSVRRGVAEIGPALGSFAFVVLCLVCLFLASRPQVKQWILAKHQLSLSQGHVPRNARR